MGHAEEKKTITNLELLQGKWQSQDDETNFLKFENNHRMEIAEGMMEWSDKVFMLSDNCANESDNGGKMKNKFRAFALLNYFNLKKVSPL